MEGSPEIERLRKQQLRAQEKGDLKEESALCNAIGDRYFQLGDYGKALRYHQSELALSAASGNLLDEGVAHRKVGECLCELGEFEEAVQHQKSHLQLSRRLKNLPEEQRALATLGRTFYIHSQSEEEQGKRDGGGEGDGVADLLLMAGTHYLQSLEVCDRLVGQLSDTELLEMRSRLYLNLGLVYEMRRDYHSARMFMVKALGVLEEMKDSATLYQCHSSLGSLHLLENHASLALPSFQHALTMASELRNRKFEVATLKDMAQCYMCLSEFEESKSCLKRCLKISESLASEKKEVPQIEKQLKAVRKILYFSEEVEKLYSSDARGKARLLDKLGDLCCALKAYPAAVKFYSKQLSVIEDCGGWSREEMGQVYVSLARTLEDCGQFSQALLYYNKEVSLLKDKPAEASESWSVIARVREAAGGEAKKVLEAYTKAISLATGRKSPREVYSHYKALVKYIGKHEDSVGPSKSAFWRKKASKFLEEHSALIQQVRGEEEEEDGQESGSGRHEDGEDSQGLDQYAGDTPDELGQSSMEEEEEQEEDRDENGRGVGMALAERPKRNIQRKINLERKNWRGETLLQVAVINNDLEAVKRLIKKGAIVNTRDNCGWTPLHEACNYGYLEVARILIGSGAHVDDPGGAGCEGVTPLIDAATNGHEAVVKLLVKSGADIRITDTRKRSALNAVEERLKAIQKDADEESIEMKERCRKVRVYLSSEMRRHGYNVTTPNKAKDSSSSSSGHKAKQKNPTEKGSEELLRGGKASNSGSRCLAGRSSKGSEFRHRDDEAETSLAVLGRKNRWNDRMLYDDEHDMSSSSRSKRRKTAKDNPFEDFKSSLPRETSKSPYKDRRSVSSDVSPSEPMQGHGSWPRAMFNPLGQLEMPVPSLIEEKELEEVEEEEKEEEEVEENGGKDRPSYRIIDNWLVDDLGKEKKTKRQERDRSVEKESRALLGMAGSSHTGGANTKMSKDRQVRLPRSSSPSVSTTRGGGGGGASDGEILSLGTDVEKSKRRGDGLKHARSTALIVSSSSESPDKHNSSDDDEEEFRRWKANREAQATQQPSSVYSSASVYSSSTYKTSATLPSISLLPTLPPPPPPSAAPPMRIRVRIQNSSYRIPCLHYQQGGGATTVGWLVTQAAERYFSQHGRRPVLSLTTADGDSLCQADPIAHVLQQDEEVVGVVQQWFTPPLVERYLVACRTSGVESLPKVLDLFDKDPDPQKLDLSNFNLLSLDSTPLLQAIQSQLNLTSINLSGNKLRDDAMPRLQMAAGELPLLQHLDLSSTGMTHQGIQMLAAKPVGNHGDSMWRSLRVLHLSHNKLGAAAGGAWGVASSGCGLDALLSMCSGLEELHADGCGLSCEVVEALSEPLKAASHLRLLSLAKNPLGNAGLCSLWGAITDLRVTSLFLSRVVTAKTTGGRSLSGVLRSEVARNYFKDGGGRYLEVLDISYCYHGDDEPLPVLMDCLGACPFLKELRLAGWGLTRGRIHALCSFVLHSSSLTALDVSGNVSLGNEGVLELLGSFQCYMSAAGVDRAEEVNLNLVACGMESPLPEELVRLVLWLKEGKGGPTVTLDLFGNLIEKDDMLLLKM